MAGWLPDLCLTAATGSEAIEAAAGPHSPSSAGHGMAPLGAGKARAVALQGWCCGIRNRLVLTAQVPPSALTSAPPGWVTMAGLGAGICSVPVWEGSLPDMNQFEAGR